MTNDANVRDFDAFWSEGETGTLAVQFEGHGYNVPLSPPAAAVMRSIRLEKEGVKTIAPDEVFDMARGVLGPGNVEAIVERNRDLSMTKLMALVGWVAQQQADAVTPPNREARRAAKRRKPSTSSSRGRSSRRTSSASTDSTSARS